MSCAAAGQEALAARRSEAQGMSRVMVRAAPPPPLRRLNNLACKDPLSALHRKFLTTAHLHKLARQALPHLLRRLKRQCKQVCLRRSSFSADISTAPKGLLNTCCAGASIAGHLLPDQARSPLRLAVPSQLLACSHLPVSQRILNQPFTKMYC